MNILDLPNEILEMVASHLDSRTLVSFAETNRRLQQITLRPTKYIKLTRESKSVERYLAKHADVVRTLDLSNCKWLPLPVSGIVKCSNITALDVVNTCLWDEDLEYILHRLPKLESLNFSFTLLHRTRDMDLKNLSSLKRVYVEVGSHPAYFRMVISLMNMLDALEDMHVNVIGAATLRPYYMLPKLDALRLEKLKRFVCSCSLADARFKNISTLLRSIFAANSTPEVEEWIKQDRDCYIYERGFFNSNLVENIHTNEKLDLLRPFYVLDLATRRHGGKFLSSPWGSPKSLRIKGCNDLGKGLHSLDLSQLFTSALVELDLTDSHGSLSEEFWPNLARSSPQLESLAVPLCSFQLPTNDSGETPSFGIYVVEQSLRKLFLKKLFIKGNSRPFPLNRSLFRSRQCLPCSMPLTALNIPNLRNLDRLEELTFNSVKVADTAWEKMTNSSARTIRLHVSQMSRFSGVRRFVQSCPRLQNFKFSGFNPPLHSEQLWEALSAGGNIKQLCLGTRSLIPLEPYCLHKVLSHVPRNVALVHFHVNNFEETSAFQSILESDSSGRSRFRFEIKFLPERSLPMDQGLRASKLLEPFSGRSLCHAESFAGFVRPVQWDVREY